MHIAFSLISATEKNFQYVGICLRDIHIWEGWERPTDFSLKKKLTNILKYTLCHMAAGKLSRIGGDSHVPEHKPSSKPRENTDSVLGLEGNLCSL